MSGGDPGVTAWKVEWSREEIVEAARTCLLRAGAITDGFSGVGAVAEPDSLVVVFRWRRDPNVYAVDVAFPTELVSPWTGLPVASADEWAVEALSRLAEDLATGLVSRGRRKVRDGYVVLDPTTPPTSLLLGPTSARSPRSPSPPARGARLGPT
ncbi:hypothetical protein AB0K12_20265 [Nonomuraea sp. NPDC049419]|uniref:hypothetical protein n=1 Tax=Nonomuraea sp. NPDC049419 TaxID=3155772 RepID=UPI0034298671